MERLTNKNEIINFFETICDDVINSTEIDLSDFTFSIKSKMMNIGAKLFEAWFYKNIGTGYKGSKIIEKIDGRTQIMKFHNNLEKNYVSCLGDIKLKRAYYKNNNLNYFPVEEKYEWLKDQYLPDAKELACYISMLEPYEHGSNMLEKLGGIKISGSSLQKITRQIGKVLVDLEDESIKTSSINHDKKKNDLLVISCDGTCINTKKNWKEVKNGVVYTVVKKNDKLNAKDKTYISRIENCNFFGRRLFIEARRRNISSAKQIITIGDGARWIWKMAKKYYPNSVEIVDWYHSTEHLWKIIEGLFGNKKNTVGQEFEKECEDLLYGGFILLLEEKILKKLSSVKIRKTSLRYKNILKEINYFKTNKKRMRYSAFKEQGFPIGSGVIEGTCKHLVQIRMKRNGMKWSFEGAHDVLQIRCLYLGGRWDEVKEIVKKVNIA